MSNNEAKLEVKRFKNLRSSLVKAGLIDSRNREQGAYYYSRNGSVRRERSAGSVAIQVRKLAKQHGIIPDIHEYPFFPCSWSGKWPRTIKSMEIEDQGIGHFNNLFWKLVNHGILTIDGFLAKGEK